MARLPQSKAGDVLHRSFFSHGTPPHVAPAAFPRWATCSGKQHVHSWAEAANQRGRARRRGGGLGGDLTFASEKEDGHAGSACATRPTSFPHASRSSTEERSGVVGHTGLSAQIRRITTASSGGQLGPKLPLLASNSLLRPCQLPRSRPQTPVAPERPGAPRPLHRYL